MTAANGSSDPTPTTATAPDSGPAIQLQPTPPTPQVSISSEVAKPATKELSRAERLVGEVRLLDRALVVLTLALAFFLASFRANNSDIWMHLAAGRLIAQGDFQFMQGVDPFSHTAEGQTWDNHAWLSDWILYAVAQAFGGPESSMAARAVVLKRAGDGARRHPAPIRRPGQVVAPAVAPASLARCHEPTALLQTTIVSYLFLGITLYLLQRPAPLSAQNARRCRLAALARPPQRLMPCRSCSRCVNLMAGTCWGRSRLPSTRWASSQDRLPASRRRGATGRAETTGIPAVGFAACLVSPYHIRGLTLPPELAAFLPTRCFMKMPGSTASSSPPSMRGTCRRRVWSCTRMSATWHSCRCCCSA